LTQRRRVIGAVLLLLLLSVVLSACGAVPVSQDWPGLTVDGGTVYVITGSPPRPTLLDAETGVQKLVFALPQPEPRGTYWWSPVTLGADLAFVGFGVPEAKTYGFYAYDPATGQIQWQIQTTDLILAAPVVADGVVYFGTSDGDLYAVDVETKGIKPGWPFKAEDALWGSPLVANGRVYVASMDHHLYCLDAQTGEQVWASEAFGAMAAQPALDQERGLLYVGDFDGRVYAVQADSGKAVEEFAFRAENWIWSTVLVAKDRLYVTSLDGNLYALDPSTGAVLSPYPISGGEVLRASPVPTGDLILVASREGTVTAVEGQTGVKRWQWPATVPVGSSILTEPVVSDGIVYVVVMVTGQPSVVYALAADTGVQAPGNWPEPDLQAK
jgi:outer membrane protein assembly factor BamB